MKDGFFKITENTQLTPSTWRMKLEGDTSAVTNPGQFINIKLDGHFLRRPISVSDVEMNSNENAEDGVVTIIYKVLGRGTEEMTELSIGTELDILTGLGNGYDLTIAGDRPLLIGGGVGIPPMYLAARRLLEMNKNVTVILGFNSRDEVYYVDEFENLGCNVIVATADGSIGVKGFVTDAYSVAAEANNASDGFTQFYTCGPEPMLKAVYKTIYKAAGVQGQMSFEERMGCGFGACMGCSIETAAGYKRVCKDGPVFKTEDILW